MTDFFDLIRRMLESGITWSTLVAAFVVFGNWQEKRHMRRMIYLIAEKVGVEWDTPQEELRKMVLLNYKRFYLLSQKETILRRMIMEKLKSRKFWLTILAALIPVINQEFNLNLDLSTVGLVMTALMAGVAALAHVDAKKVLASIVHPTVTSSGTSNIKWDNLTFKEAAPFIQIVHNGINSLLTDVKRNDGSQAAKDAMRAYNEIEVVLDAYKKTEPLPEVTDEQVSA